MPTTPTNDASPASVTPSPIDPHTLARASSPRLSRRAWLLAGASGVAGAGAVIWGWAILPPRSRIGAPAMRPDSSQAVRLNGWIRIGADGRIGLAMPRSEMGQGVHTALAMLAAEELEVPLSMIELVPVVGDAIYGNVAMQLGSLPIHPRHEADAPDAPIAARMSRWFVAKIARELGLQVTGGSSSVADAWDVVRLAAASARGSLVAAAARRWQVPEAALRVRDGAIEHADGRRLGFAELAREAVSQPVRHPQPKPPSAWTLIGQPVARTDTASKIDGSARFGMDVRLPGLIYAAVRMAPQLGGRIVRVDDSAARALGGALRTVELPAEAGSTAGIAVVADGTWQAMRAVEALRIEWAPPASGLLSSDAARRAQHEALRGDEGFTFFSQGDRSAVPGGRRISATYEAPMLAHAALEPINCTAQVRDGRVRVWVPTQVPQFAREVAARVAGVDAEKVEVIVTLLGGGFGRRLEVDAVAQAVRVALACDGRPVQLVWPRSEDMTHDFYRPMQTAQLSAVLAPDGRALAIEGRSAGDAITPRWLGRNAPWLAGPIDMPDKTTNEGLFDQPYDIAVQRFGHVALRSGLPVGFWRSVGHSHNAFFLESFIDELAEAAQSDPLAWRLRHLPPDGRHARVLREVGRLSRWQEPPPSGRARGCALHESFGSIVAMVAEVSRDESGGPRVHEAWVAVDCGVVVNPNIVRQQVEGSVAFGLSAAIHESVEVSDGAVKPRNFDGYRLLRLAEAPQVHTAIVPAQRPPCGIGEPVVPVVAPAVANAWVRLGARRPRSLPLRAQ
ncbi:MAG: xanthine dehydrogenase family protein molybdopterin-binding subunit [Betaproteobacteria bacterium]|nr:xanthine dehydrogenase family protein molybdopterin-binding subunit [Betaproteobacteria bacterium]